VLKKIPLKFDLAQMNRDALKPWLAPLPALIEKAKREAAQRELDA
jgi:hypothetical protein